MVDHKILYSKKYWVNNCKSLVGLNLKNIELEYEMFDKPQPVSFKSWYTLRFEFGKNLIGNTHNKQNLYFEFIIKENKNERWQFNKAGSISQKNWLLEQQYLTAIVDITEQLQYFNSDFNFIENEDLDQDELVQHYGIKYS